MSTCYGVLNIEFAHKGETDMRKSTLLIFILCFGSTLSCAGKPGTMKTEVRSLMLL